MLLARFGSSSVTSADLVFAFNVSLPERFSTVDGIFDCGASANRVASTSESSPGTPLLSFEHQTLPVLAAAAGTFSLIHGRDFSFNLGRALIVAAWEPGSAGAGGIGAFGGGGGAVRRPAVAAAAEGGGGGGAGGTPAGLVVGLVLVVGDEVLPVPTATEARGLR
eukprot:COSAG02_NODE_967_length_15586_cov_9.185704_4_plen_165_part_00